MDTRDAITAERLNDMIAAAGTGNGDPFLQIDPVPIRVGETVVVNVIGEAAANWIVDDTGFELSDGNPDSVRVMVSEFNDEDDPNYAVTLKAVRDDVDETTIAEMRFCKVKRFPILPYSSVKIIGNDYGTWRIRAVMVYSDETTEYVPIQPLQPMCCTYYNPANGKIEYINLTFTADGDAIPATDYCPAGNEQRLEWTYSAAGTKNDLQKIYILFENQQFEIGSLRAVSSPSETSIVFGVIAT